MTAFDWGAYLDLKESAFSKLQELYEIDLVLDGLDRIDYDNKPQDFLENIATRADPNEMFTWNIGRTYPFEVKGYRFKDPGWIDVRFPWENLDEHDYSFISEAPGKAATWAEGSISSYTDVVEPLLRVDSESYARLVRLLLRPLAALDRIEANFAYLENDWEGRSADNFFLHFYEPFADIRENHMWGIDQLTVMVAHLKACNDAGQVALMNLLEQVEAAADEQLLLRKSLTTDKPSDRSAYAVASGATTVLAGLTVTAPPVAAAFTVLAGALAVMSAIPEDAATLVPIRGTRATDFDDALAAAVSDLVVNVNAKFQYAYSLTGDVTSAVDGLSEHVRGTPGGYDKWEPIQPRLEPGEDGRFYHESSGRAT